MGAQERTGQTTMPDTTPDLRRHQGDYGLDGNFQLISARGLAAILAAVLLLLTGWTVRSLITGAFVAATVTAAVALLLVLQVAVYLRTTRLGKFEVWARILADLRLRGDEQLLDLGCGRGAVLLAAAKLIPRGRAFGIDRWRADQTGNGPDATRSNAVREGVADRIELRTADMTRLPFADDTFDVVVSSLAVHNVPSAAGRRAALDEAVRVIRPGGRLAIADLWAVRQHTARLRELGLNDVRRRNLGWRMWWGGPWLATWLVTATKPAEPSGGA
jgi:arsenite methyltransferase